jgi:hypothetical protein
MPAADTAFAAKVREQVDILKQGEYNYDQLRVYVCGIARPWTFGPSHEFEFDGDEVLVVRLGPSHEFDNEGVPEVVIPLRQVVATELTVSEG